MGARRHWDAPEGRPQLVSRAKAADASPVTAQIASASIFTGLDVLFFAVVGAVLAVAAVVARVVIGNKPRTFELPAVAAPAQIAEERTEQAVAS